MLPDAPRRGAARSWRRRLALALAGLFSLGALFGLLVAALIISGPIRVDFLRDRIVRDLGQTFGQNYAVGADAIYLDVDEGRIGARLDGLVVRDRAGRTVIDSPSAMMEFDAWALLAFRLAPKRLAVERLDLRLDISADGGLSISTGAQPGPALASAPVPAPAAAPPADAPSETKPAASGALVAALGDLDRAFAEEGMLGHLQGVALKDGRLIIRHQVTGHETIFRNLSIAQTGDSDRGRSIQLLADGPRGPVNIRIDTRRKPEGYQTNLVANEISLSDLATLAGQPPLAEDANAPVMVAVELMLDPERTRAQVTGRVIVGASRFSIDGSPEGYTVFDESELSFGWRSDTGYIDIYALSTLTGGSSLTLAGRLEQEAGQPERWRIALTGKNGVIEPLRPEDGALRLETVEILGAVDFQAKTIDFSKVTVQGAGFSLATRLNFSFGPEGVGVVTSLESRKLPVRHALRLWPAFLSPELRAYLVKNLLAGTIESISISSNMPAAVLKDAMAKRPLPEDSVRGEVVVSGATLQAIDGLPPLSQVQTTGTLTGRTTTWKVPRAVLELGNNRRLQLSDGAFSVADTARHPADAKISFRVQGGADAAADLLSRAPLRGADGQSIDPALVRGTVDVAAQIALPLIAKPKRQEVVVQLNGTLAGIFVDKAFGKEGLENANLTLTTDKNGSTVKGEGKIFGATSSILYRKPPGEIGEFTVQFALDDAARAKRGLGFGGGLKGPVGVIIKTAPKANSADQARVVLDFAKASVDGLLPGWVKPVGKPGQIAFDYQQSGNTVRLSDFSADAGAISAAGAVTLDEDGALKSARFDTFRLSPGDSIKLEVDKVGAGYRAVARGNNLDARPFLRASSPGDPEPLLKEIDLDLKVAVLSGFNGEAIANTELRLQRKGKEMRLFTLAGKLSGSPVIGQTSKGGMSIECGDAGGFLRFMDVYQRMIGGRLDINWTGDALQQDGVVLVRDFLLRDEPAMRSLSNAGNNAQVGRDAEPATGGRPALALGRDVAFIKLRADFSRDPGKLTFNDAVIWGRDVGGSIQGTMDYANDRVNLTGTFVPAYQLNNFFARVPLFGMFLSGGQNEGLFAVSFRISGKVSAPTLQVNPLSALAPGFLRKIFEFRSEKPAN